MYDALNVLMAMDIISKEKKEIRWKGLPCNAQHDIELLQREKRALEDSVAKKKEHLQELILQVRPTMPNFCEPGLSVPGQPLYHLVMQSPSLPSLSACSRSVSPSSA